MGRSQTRQAVLAVALALGLAACGPGEAGSAVPQRSGALALARAAKIIRVPQDQPTIAAAMAVALAGDTVRLAPGTYRETLALRAGVRVVGGPSTIDAAGLDNGMTADASVKDVSVFGITVQNASLQGIRLDGAEVRLRQVVSRASGAASGSAGLLAHNGARVSLSECELSGNGGRGLSASFSNVTVEASRILDNGAAGIGMEGSTARISNSLLRGNGGLANVRVSYGSSATLEHNQILGGSAGVAVDDGLDPADSRPAEAKLSGNVASGTQSFGLVVYGGTARTEGNHFDGNAVYGLYASGHNPGTPLARVESEGDTFDGNADNGIVTLLGASVTVKDGSISGNAGTALFASAADVLCADLDCTSLVFVTGSSRVALDHVRPEDNRGGGVQAYAGSQVAVRASRVARNAADNSAAGGIFLNSEWQYDIGDGLLHFVDLPSSVTVRDSIIQGNNGWCAAVYFSSRLDLGGAEGGANSCLGNSLGAVGNATSPPVTIPAKGNWWGTADAAAIAAMMVGPVDFVPFLSSAP